MVTRYWVVVACSALLMFTSGEMVSAKSSSKIPKVKLTPARVLRGKWRGKAVFESARREARIEKGQEFRSDLEFKRGDLKAVSGTAINSIKSGKLRAFSTSKRYVDLTLIYSVGGSHNYSLSLKARFDEFFTKMTGKFSAMIGQGSFELSKQDCAPPADALKGDYGGQFAASGKKPTPMVLKTGSGRLDRATATIGEDYEATETRPSVWEPETRKVIFFLVCKKNGEETSTIAEVAGQFNKEFTELLGTFKSKSIGSGNLTLTQK